MGQSFNAENISYENAIANSQIIEVLIINIDELKKFNQNFSMFPNLKKITINDKGGWILSPPNNLQALLPYSIDSINKYFPANLDKLPYLQELHLNYFTDKIPSELFKIKNIEELAIKLANVNNIETIISDLKKLTRLKTIFLLESILSVDDKRKLLNSLPHIKEK
jgi:hypothetical protein